MPTAVLIDGDFFLRRYRKVYKNQKPIVVAKKLHEMCLKHVEKQGEKKSRHRSLYRIFYYDCPPLTKRVHNPISQKVIDFAKTPLASWRSAFHDELKKLRKVALRLGYLNAENVNWVVKPEKMKKLFRKEITIDDLDESDVRCSNIKQKGVDMRIGLDIASMSFKRQVDQIILVSGDSDFVPAAKLARREGVDFILDPMWSNIRSDLHEHIDGLSSVLPRPNANKPIADDGA